MERPSLYDFAGGGPALLRLAAAHHQRCLDDPVLNHPFSHPGHPQHVERLAGYWGEVLGGPPSYSTSCGGQSAMLDILPDDPEFRSALRAYMEWAVSDVMVYSPQASIVPGSLPVPHWSWDGLEATGAAR
jgi:hemoglobin